MTDRANEMLELVQYAERLKDEIKALKEIASWPPCMAPDGGECCPQYHKLKNELDEVKAHLKEGVGIMEEGLSRLKRKNEIIKDVIEMLKAPGIAYICERDPIKELQQALDDPLKQHKADS